MVNKRGFPYVEIIITIAIIALLTVIGMSSKQQYTENTNNTKVITNVETINNALESFYTDLSRLPMPDGNTNFYSIDTTYRHSYFDHYTFGVYGSFTEETLPKKYLDVTPIDPNTNSYFAYGRTKASKEFEIGSVQFINSEPFTKITGNYSGKGTYSLIREYNGPNFISNGSNSSFPYNPYELILIARVDDGEGNWNTYKEGDTITSNDKQKEIYFSDGSKSILETNSQIQLSNMNFKSNNNLNTYINIGLKVGTIWTKATNLDNNSNFKIYTSDTTAAVRGTIFGIQEIDNNTKVKVIEGSVNIFKNGIFIKTLKANDGQDIGDIAEFTKSDDYRKDEVIEGIDSVLSF